MKTRVKVVVQMKPANTPGWPCINFDYDKELKRVMEPVYAMNPDMEFDICKYTHVSMAQNDYQEDLKKYDGVLVLLMTNWIKLDKFYINQSKEGLPTIVCDVPFCGSGSTLEDSRELITEGGFPVPLVASTDFNDIAKAVKLFDVMKKIKDSKILVVRKEELANDPVAQREEAAATKIWGCQFINKPASVLMSIFDTITDAEAKPLADKWMSEAFEIREASSEDILAGAKIYYAVKKLMKETGATSVTIDCLSLSYNDHYGNNRHMYPCLSHFQMGNDGEVGVCESDINSTISCLIARFLANRPGYVSDPVVDTSSDEITYSHCVACRKVYGEKDPCTCKYTIRSHAEDKLGAAVQVTFPVGDKLTTIQMNNVNHKACIHSSKSIGNFDSQNGCRSKLVASCNADNILDNWMPQWHRVTIFGDYRRLIKYLFKMKGFKVVEEDMKYLDK